MTTTKAAVRPFDFRQSHRLSADQVRTLERIHGQWATLLATYLTAYLRSHVTCSVAGISQGTIEDVLNAFPPGSAAATATFETLPGKGLIRMDGPLAQGVIDRMLGGSGDIVTLERPMTEIDAQVLERGMPIVFDSLAEAWNGLREIHPQVNSIEFNPQFLRIAAPQEAVVEVRLAMSLGNVDGSLSLLLPYDLLKPVLPSLTSVALLAEPDSSTPLDTEGSKRIKTLIMGARLSLTAVLGHANITVRDFLNLAEGDVLVLTQKVSQPLTIEVQGKPKFKGQPRSRRRHLALVITDMLDGAREEGERG